MLRIVVLFLFWLLQANVLFGQSETKPKTVDALVDSFLVKNKLLKIPNDMFVRVQIYKIKELDAFAIRITVAKWEDVKNSMDHFELYNFYRYNLMNGQSVLFQENRESQVDKSSFLVKERLYPTDYEFLEKVKLRSTNSKKRTDIFMLDYVYFLTPEHFQWKKIRDSDEEVEGTTESAEEITEE